MRWYKSIKYQIPIFLCAFTFVLMISLFIFVYKKNNAILIENVHLSLVQTIERVIERFDMEVYSNLGHYLKTIKSSPIIDEYFDSSQDEKDYYKSSVFKLLRSLNYISNEKLIEVRMFNNRLKEEIYVKKGVPITKKKAHYLNKTKNPVFDELYKKYLEYNKSNNYLIDPSSNYIYAISSLKSKQYTFNRGYIIIGYDLNDFFSSLENIRYENISCIWMFDRDNNLITSPVDMSYISTPKNHLNSLSKVPNVDFDDSGVYATKSILNKNTGQVLLSVGIGFIPEYIFSKINQSQKYLLMILALAVVSTILVSYYFVIKLINPILKLDDISDKIKNGESVHPKDIDLAVDNEVGQLSKHLSSMISEINNQHDTLQGMVETRTKELQEVTNSAVDANVAKSTFLTNVSHEILTPMTALLGMIEHLRSTEEDIAKKEQLNNAFQSGCHMNNLINDILEYTRLESGKYNKIEDTFNLLKSCKQVISSLEILAKRKNINVELEYNLSEEVFIGDDVKIRQILYNLLGNGIKFTNEGKVVLNVTSEQDVTGTYNIIFNISDTGVGVDKELIPHLFNVFEVVNSNGMRKYANTGIGLAICREIVTHLNGEISAKSVKGVGTTITFMIPLESSAAEEENSIETDETFDHDFSGKKILFIDESQANLNLAKIILTDENASVVTAENGNEAITKSLEHKYDIILIDCFLSEVSGFEVLKDIRQNRFNLNQNTPVIALSTICTSKIDEKYDDLKVCGILKKPFNRADLLNIIDENLE